MMYQPRIDANYVRMVFEFEMDEIIEE